MNKKLIALAVAGVISGYGAAANAAEVSGFAVVDYTITDDGAVENKGTATEHNTTEGKFGAKGEVDFVSSPVDGVTVRVDVDLNLDPGSTHSGAELEQAMFAWSATDDVTVLGGVFNNPIGHEAEDKPDMIFNDHGAVYIALDSQTELDGDNVAGVAVAGAIGPVTLTGAFLNDLNGAHEENSLALVANYSPIAGLDLELGLATQEGNALTTTTAIPGGSNTSVGDVTNFNIVYTGITDLELGLDYLMGDEVLDSAYDVWGQYTIGSSGFSVAARMSEIEYNAADVTKVVNGAIAAGGTAQDVLDAMDTAGLPMGDAESTAINVTYKVASNLKAALEFASTDVTPVGGGASESFDMTTLKLTATF